MIKISINGSVNKNLTKILAKMCAQVKKKNNENKQEPQKLPYLKSLKPTWNIFPDRKHYFANYRSNYISNVTTNTRQWEPFSNHSKNIWTENSTYVPCLLFVCQKVWVVDFLQSLDGDYCIPYPWIISHPSHRFPDFSVK